MEISHLLLLLGYATSIQASSTFSLKEVQELITSWNELIKTCDRIFLRAPSFNRKIFFSGKAPPLNKDDERIRLIPFPTRRPTFNEVRRVYEMLASIECYGIINMRNLLPVTSRKCVYYFTDICCINVTILISVDLYFNIMPAFHPQFQYYWSFVIY
jgi:hypothetical protein